MKSLHSITLLIFIALLDIGCAKKTAETPAAPSARHVHKAPNGGTLVELGKHQFNLEFLFDETRGVLQAWVLNAHAERPVRGALAGFEVVARADGQTYQLQFKATDNPLTGETVGNTSLFEAPAEWLTAAKSFEGELMEISIQGTRFVDIVFNFSVTSTSTSVPDRNHIKS